MSLNSRQKGAAGEREWAQFLCVEAAALGFSVSARRGQQFAGSPDSPDVVCRELPIHWEVKRVERLQIERAMSQSIRDSRGGSIPAVAHRKNRSDWLVTVRATDFLAMAIAAEKDTEK